MQLHDTVQQQPLRTGKRLRTIEAFIGSNEAIAEINAYIAIRDGLLVEAEQIRTAAKIDSVKVANDFVMTCLKPARPPYESQCLPEATAIRERKRCAAVKARLEELTAQITAKPVPRPCAVVR
jgi:hypothetical protein